MGVTANHDPFGQIELQALGYFVQIAEAGAFFKASVLLNVTQPTLSRHIQRLEEQLGTRLFDRTGRGVLLTETGRSLYEHGKAILGRIQVARAEIADIDGNPSGSAVLGLAPIFGKVLSVPVAKRFLAQVPNSRLRIIEGFTGYVLEWIATGRIDVAILYDDAVAAPFEGERLWSEDLFVFGRKGGGLDGRQALPFAELDGLPLIIPGLPHGLRLKIDEIAAQVGIKLNVVLEIDGLNAILDLVQSGVGHAILTPPALYGYHGSGSMTLTRLIDPVASATVVALSSKQRPRTKAVQTLLQIIRDEAKAVRANGPLRANAADRSRWPSVRQGPL